MRSNSSPFTPLRGLSEAEVQARLKTEGYNELPRPERRNLPRILLKVAREPMLALLLGSGSAVLFIELVRKQRPCGV
jgi:Ca2+-transporting ATPase